MLMVLFIAGCQGGPETPPGEEPLPGDEPDPTDPGMTPGTGMGVAATVNGEEISEEEVAQMAQQYQAMGQPADEGMIVQNLIQMELLQQEADARGLSVSDQEVEEHIQELLGDEMSLDELKTQAGPQYQMLLEEQKLQMKIQEIAREEGDVSVTDEEVEQFYEENKEMIGDASLEEIRPQIEQTLEQELLNNVLMGLLQELEAEATIEIEEGYEMQQPEMVMEPQPEQQPEQQPEEMPEIEIS